MSKNSDRTYCIYLELEPYLKEWLINECGGRTPVYFPKLSVENRILETFLIKLPPNASPDLSNSSNVAVAIPKFKNSDPATYNYLPVYAKKELKNTIRNRFIIELWRNLHHYGHIGKRRDHLIYGFMESHGIEINDTNYNTIAKIYLRQHRAYLARERRKQKSKKN